MLLKEPQLKLFHAHDTSMWASSCSLDFKTEVARLSGALPALDGIHLNLFIPEQYAHTLLSNLAENNKLSFLFASTSTYESYQVKGTFLGYRSCTTEEMSYQKNYIEGFAQCMRGLGIKAGPRFAPYYREPSIAIRMKGEAIFEQTPKTGTGTKIR